MSTATVMGRQRPSPPKQSEVQYNLHHLAKHNATVPYQEPIYGPDGGLYLPSSQSNSLYSSSSAVLPGSAHNAHLFDGDAFSRFHDLDGLGIRYESYGTPIIMQKTQNSPSPALSSVSSRKTRSGRILRSSPADSPKGGTGKSGTSKPSRAKATRKKAHNTKAPHIDKPLSELTKDLTNVPIRDMDEWVHRSDDVRYKEVEKRNGYIARPMNSFMLYRSAYAERTKVWCVQNNHQVVSAVSGESWPLEPPEIRDKYNELANIERANHAKAHPEYKFSPSKGGQSSRKKEVVSSDEGSDQSEVEDGDSEWRPRGARSGSAKSMRRGRREESHQPSESPMAPQYDDFYFGSSYDFNRSWELSTEPREVPSFMVPIDSYSQYYQAPVYPVLQSHDTAGMRMHPIALPTTQYEISSDGIAGSYNLDPLPLGHQENTPEYFESHIDPTLSQLQDPSATHEAETNLFGDHYEQAPVTSQFEDWMDQEERG